MDEALFTLPINPNNFPAKLWCLVNNPRNRSIHWDHSGLGILINQHLFETELFSPAQCMGEPIFKTTNFTSFIRQLNLYGFRKVELSSGNAENVEDDDHMNEGVQRQHRFQNPNFIRNHPELLVNLKRLTTSNKAKIEAGLEVSCRPPSRIQRILSTAHEEDMSEISESGSVFVGPVHGGFHDGCSPSYQYHPRRQLFLKGHERTPIPQRSLVGGHGDPASPRTTFVDKGIPVSILQRFRGGTSCSAQSTTTTKLVQMGPQEVLAPQQKYNNLIPCHAPFSPGFYTTVSQCCSSGSVNPNMAACVCQPPPSVSQFNYCQPNYPAGFFHPGNQDWPINGNEDIKTSDVNLEMVFQIVDELQVSAKPSMVKVESPDESEVSSASKQVLSISASLSTHCTATSFPENVLGRDREKESPPQETSQLIPLDFSQRMLKNVENISGCHGETSKASSSEPSSKLDLSTSPSKAKDCWNTRQQQSLESKLVDLILHGQRMAVFSSPGQMSSESNCHTLCVGVRGQQDLLVEVACEQQS